MNKIIVAMILIIVLIGISLIGQKASITGYVILPANIQGQEEVVDYVKQTEQFKNFEAKLIEEPNLEKIYLCSYPYDAELCQIIEDNIKRFGWEKTYYWYLRFSGKKWLGKEIQAEFLIRGDNGVIVQSHVG